jgi:hypothetical protein
MVKAAKFLVLAAGLIGLVAFFLPFLSVEAEGKSVSVSAFQAVRGISVVEGVVDEAAGTPSAASAEGQKAMADLDELLTKVKAFLYVMYAPALLLVLLGVIGVVKQKFGRGLGILSFLFGLVALGFWALLFMAAGEANKGDTQGQVALGLGVQLMLGAGALAVIGGLTNTIKPDRD